MGVGGGGVDEEVQAAKTRTPLEGRASSALPRWADRARAAAGHTSSSPPLCASRRPGLTAGCIVHIYHITSRWPRIFVQVSYYERKCEHEYENGT